MTAIDDIDIGARLRGGDPLLDQPSLPPADVDAMRRAIVNTAISESAESSSWFPPLLALVATAAALTIAVAGARSRPNRSPEFGTEAGRAIQASGEGATVGTTEGRRQLQFATPGGTRVIWVFDPEFNP